MLRGVYGYSCTTSRKTQLWLPAEGDDMEGVEVEGAAAPKVSKKGKDSKYEIVCLQCFKKGHKSIATTRISIALATWDIFVFFLWMWPHYWISLSLPFSQIHVPLQEHSQPYLSGGAKWKNLPIFFFFLIFSFFFPIFPYFFPFSRFLAISLSRGALCPRPPSGYANVPSHYPKYH